MGCGPGDLWVDNGDRIPPGWTIVLSDFSPGMVRRARHRLGSDARNLDYRILDVQAIPFPNQCFDAVVANHMLYHVPDRRGALLEIHRVLRPGGRLYATTNGLGHLRELRVLVDRFCPDADTVKAATEFGLENGEAQLSDCFAHVARYRQENALVVTEAGPLIGYARSMMGHKDLQLNVAAFSHSVRKQIAAHGAIHIQKDSGIFVATKA